MAIRLESRKTSVNSAVGKTLSVEAVWAELEQIQELLDIGDSRTAEERLNPILKLKTGEQKLQATIQLTHSRLLELRGDYRQALEAVQKYEPETARLKLDETLDIKMQVQIALCYNYLNDAPKAVALLQDALKDTSEDGSDELLGLIYVSLSRVYRWLTEYSISRDYAEKGLKYYRTAGDWRGMIQAYGTLTLTIGFEGKYDEYLETCEQMLKIIGDRPASYLLGKIYSDMAAVYGLLHRMTEGIECLEKSIQYFEQTDHRVNALNAYNNLAWCLFSVGAWQKCYQILQQAWQIKSPDKPESEAMILDTLSLYHLERGDFAKCFELVQNAIAITETLKKQWYKLQAIRTLCRYYLVTEDIEKALETAIEMGNLAESAGDNGAARFAVLYRADAFLRLGRIQEFEVEMEKVFDALKENQTDLLLFAEANLLRGISYAKLNQPTTAVQYLNHTITTYEFLKDPYRTALAYYESGFALAKSEPHKAKKHLLIALKTFQELGAKPALEKTEKALSQLDLRKTSDDETNNSALTQLLTLRLAEAVVSRTLLLRELAAILHQETQVEKVLIFETDNDESLRFIVEHGFAEKEVSRLLRKISLGKTNAEKKKIVASEKFSLIVLSAPNSRPAFVLIDQADLEISNQINLKPLFRVVELGMDVCALREKDRVGRQAKTAEVIADHSLLPGFIHSSPAMRQLVEEVYKIRSSDVTVLVTGESGTGKELVSRAIHTLSTRKDKVFIPFNCTAVPKELADAHLFGYKKGSFTGAMNDSKGVIRSAEGGTLFLDEIGDLPLDVQPKLLRFLQEGEVQTLGEQKPTKVDVRIVAATNTALEDMVADGRFREDLYYRLNVIRLRVPPLRERRSEIPAMVNYYVNHYSEKFKKKDISITPQAIDLLMVCDWQGNVRQLCNEVQRIIARSDDGKIITPDDLSPELKRISTPIPRQNGNGSHSNVVSLNFSNSAFDSSANYSNGNGKIDVPEDVTLEEAVSELEQKMIAKSMQRHKGNISRVARELGLTRRGLYMKLERYKMSA